MQRTCTAGEQGGCHLGATVVSELARNDAPDIGTNAREASRRPHVPRGARGIRVVIACARAGPVVRMHAAAGSILNVARKVAAGKDEHGELPAPPELIEGQPT